MEAAIYTQVSTAKQNIDRQLAELQDYANRNSLEVVQVPSETVFGNKKKMQRPGLEEIFGLASCGAITEALTLELPRLGHNAMDVRQIILDLADLGVCVHVVNKNLRSLDQHRKKMVSS